MLAKLSAMQAEAVDDRPRVLVVDSEAARRQKIAEALDGTGCAVCAWSPTEATDRASEDLYSAVVIGRVPDPGRLADALRQATPHAPVIVLGASASDPSRDTLDILPETSLDDGCLAQAVLAACRAASLWRRNRELSLELDRSNRLRSALDRIAAEHSGPPDLDLLLAALVAGAKELTAAETARVIVYAHSHDDRGLVVETAAGDGAEALVGARFHPGEGLAATAVAEQAAFLLDDGRDHDSFRRRSDALPTELPGYLCVPLLHGSVRGAITVAGRQRPFEQNDLEGLKTLAAQAAVSADNAMAAARAFNFFTHTADLLVSLLDRVDVFYPGHSRASAALADMMTRRLGLPEAERRLIHFAALLHDVGKLRLDPIILASEGRWKEIRPEIERHPELAVEMLKSIAAWHDLLPIILSHHERWDGQGYPHGLQGEDIPLGARVIAVSETFDAMIHRVGHGARRSREEALKELETGAGRQFDPRIVRLFLLEYRQHSDQVEP